MELGDGDTVAEGSGVGVAIAVIVAEGSGVGVAVAVAVSASTGVRLDIATIVAATLATRVASTSGVGEGVMIALATNAATVASRSGVGVDVKRGGAAFPQAMPATTVSTTAISLNIMTSSPNSRDSDLVYMHFTAVKIVAFHAAHYWRRNIQTMHAIDYESG